MVTLLGARSATFKGACPGLCPGLFGFVEKIGFMTNMKQAAKYSAACFCFNVLL